MADEVDGGGDATVGAGWVSAAELVVIEKFGVMTGGGSGATAGFGSGVATGWGSGVAGTADSGVG